ncbi:SDR family NAD(P)-dependent oxidoreductase [Mucilaginibacter pedocola]|uniref:Short-chain dehydrogenase n=1 Tax=Mucilaginibacter pedocola TaxID=1792845 RepID=A0A1S9P6D4_9SPHI|nr:SDR family oxidoreductase [Mucilaginibacter pedocola]OOQ56514.1 short-chain dehydrogenase [Mucilaginibacter pedocola]
MMLQNKNAVIYGAGGSLGGAVAKAFAAAGARVFLTGHRIASMQKIADKINQSGGIAEVAEVDGYDENAINAHLAEVLQKARSIDISFNAVGVDVTQGMPLVNMSMDDFVLPVTQTLHTRFLTAKAAGNAMMKQGSGVILFLTATPGGIGYPYTGGFAPACTAVESLSRNLAAELGVYGVRVVTIRSGGSPDSKVFSDAIESIPDVMEGVLSSMENDTMLKQLPLMADIANTAVFLSSEMAGKITGCTIDVTSGTTAGLNYRVPKV